MNQNSPYRPSTEVQPSLTVTKIKPVPRIISVSVAEELNADFTRNVVIECRNEDGTTDGLYYSYNGDSDRKRLEGGKAVLALPKGSYIITVTNDSGKAVQSDEFTINVDAVTKITIDKTDTYMNVGMTGTLTTAFETIGNPADSEKSVKWNSSAPKTVSVKDGHCTESGYGDNNSKRIGQHFRLHFRQYRNNGHGFTQSAEDHGNKAASSARSIQ